MKRTLDISVLDVGRTAGVWAEGVAKKHGVSPQTVGSIYVMGALGIPKKVDNPFFANGSFTEAGRKLWADADEAYFRHCNSGSVLSSRHFTFQQGDVVEFDGRRFLVLCNLGFSGLVHDYPVSDSPVLAHMLWQRNGIACRKVAHVESPKQLPRRQRIRVE